MTKKIKIIAVILLLIIMSVVSFPIGLVLGNKNDDIEELLSKSLSSKKMSLLSLSLKRNVFNEVNDKSVNYKLLNVSFFSVNDLLSNKITDFYSASIKIKGNNAKVVISYYKSGLMFIFSYTKRNDKWMEIYSDWGRVKFEPSKPYYIYLENMRLTNPDYKNYDIRMIPRDSLK